MQKMENNIKVKNESKCSFHDKNERKYLYYANLHNLVGITTN